MFDSPSNQCDSYDLGPKAYTDDDRYVHLDTSTHPWVTSQRRTYVPMLRRSNTQFLGEVHPFRASSSSLYGALGGDDWRGDGLRPLPDSSATSSMRTPSPTLSNVKQEGHDTPLSIHSPTTRKEECFQSHEEMKTNRNLTSNDGRGGPSSGLKTVEREASHPRQGWTGVSGRRKERVEKKPYTIAAERPPRPKPKDASSTNEKPPRKNWQGRRWDMIGWRDSE